MCYYYKKVIKDVLLRKNVLKMLNYIYYTRQHLHISSVSAYPLQIILLWLLCNRSYNHSPSYIKYLCQVEQHSGYNWHQPTSHLHFKSTLSRCNHLQYEPSAKESGGQL